VHLDHAGALLHPRREESAMPKPIRAASLVAAVTLLAACGGGGKDAPPPATPDGRAVVAVQEGKARELVRAGPRTLLGADAALVLAELDAARSTALSSPALIAAPAPAVAATPAPLPSGEATGSTVAALLLLAEQGLDLAAVNGGTSQKHREDTTGTTDSSTLFTASLSQGTLAGGVTARTVHTGKDGAVVEERATGSFDVKICPDADGKVVLHYAFHMDFTVPGGAGQFDLSGTTTATVDDGARLASWGSDLTLTYAASGGAVPVTGGQVQLTARSSKTAGQTASFDVTTVRESPVAGVNRSAVEILGTMAPTLEEEILQRAQKHWQAGECVEIVLEGAGDANDVAPSSTTAFTGKVRHRLEAVELPLPISAGLSGAASLAPTAATPAPVAYAYAAPPEEKKQATASFETRSRRGVAKRAVNFTTRAATGYGGTISFHWTAASATETVSGAGTATVRFVVSSTAGGGRILQADPSSGSVSVTRFDLTSSTRTCTLSGVASGGPGSVLGSMTVLVVGPPANSYMFAGIAQAQGGTLRCVRTSDGKVTSDPFATAANFGTMTAPPDPGWQPLGDGKLLTGSATWNVQDGTTTSAWTTDWSLTPH
jgi:hypothetical protein